LPFQGFIFFVFVILWSVTIWVLPLSFVLPCLVSVLVLGSHVECLPVVHSQSFLLPLVALCRPALCGHTSMMSFFSFDSFTIICSMGDSLVLSCVVLVLFLCCLVRVRVRVRVRVGVRVGVMIMASLLFLSFILVLCFCFVFSQPLKE
jgi:hypothetical protein